MGEKVAGLVGSKVCGQWYKEANNNISSHNNVDCKTECTSIKFMDDYKLGIVIDTVVV